MPVDVRTQSVLLLTVRLKKPVEGDPLPLTATEWGRFAGWMRAHEIPPEYLLAGGDTARFLKGLSDPAITPDRVMRLLDRSAALGFALEKWERAGLWVMSCSDSDYPARLKRRLNDNAPPILFGCGNRALLDHGGVAVIGSREADDQALAFTVDLASDIAVQGFSVVSGGARGVDEAAMLGALEKEGTVIGVLADSLLRTAMSARYRKGLMDRDLVLISPFNPEAGFDVGNAMARNKYIYCLADAAVVVVTGKSKGGTWNGAVENIRKAWVPLWVRPHPDAASGNAALVKNGARWIPEGAINIRTLMEPVENRRIEPSQPGLFDDGFSALPMGSQARKPETVAAEKPEIKEPASVKVSSPISVESGGKPPELPPQNPYDDFLAAVERETRLAPQTKEVLQQRLAVSKAQMADWIKRAVAEGKVSKLNRPVRYQTVTSRQEILEL